jgi:hypothetical protein
MDESDWAVWAGMVDDALNWLYKSVLDIFDFSG